MAIAVAGMSGNLAHADYPDHPVELIVPSSPGGGTDLMARVIAEVSGKYMPQPFVVSNKPGAGGGIGMGDVQRAKPDGYKVAVLISELAILPHLKMISFTEKDFVPIARLNGDPGTIVVKSDTPWSNVQALIEAAKKNPGALSMGNAGAGTIWHLAAAAIERDQGVKFNNISFQGAAPSVTALLGGHVQAIVVSPVEVNTYIRSGQLKMLGVMTDARLTGEYASVPTLKESGINVSVGTWRGLGVPKNTPDNVVEYLRDVSGKIVTDPKFKEGMAHANLAVSYQKGPAFATFMAQQSGYFKDLISTVDIKK
ncbi:ABC transporter substrate-binding protein [Advenella kashmirensis W13003]|uniref:ABC transporter substrate-binding protein n=2 Tax=Advenella kashmirensis TaxID=310575 RepID=V8QYX8_9BURK|nr:ABC transporter substrate-binding protein [Advenella kashmirensis W13003]